jgi:BirA family biotin operon repressor/biotin-[acetyl-CoA-carboxylase] ligase
VAQLHTRAAAAGVRLFAHQTIGSTNTEALRLARSGEQGPLWVFARSQTAGRGRRSREWISEPGNFYGSFLLRAPSLLGNTPQLSFVAALALHDALCALTGWTAELKLKWPNDLLHAGAKLAGILVEGEGQHAVVGIGVNCAHHPERTRYPATDLASAGVSVLPDEILTQLSAAMLERLTQWDEGAGFVRTRGDWLARAHERGSEMRVATGERELSGVFEDLDETGRLILRLPDGSREAITAGDVFPMTNMTRVGRSTSGPASGGAHWPVTVLPHG